MSGERLEHQVRVDRRRAVADQRREVVHLARLAGLEHEAGLQARALAHEVVVDGGDGEQRRDRGARRARRRGRTGRGCWRRRRSPRRPARRSRRTAQHHALRARRRPRHVIGIVCERKTRGVDAAQRLELVVAQDRVRDHELVRVLGRPRRAGCASEPTPVRIDITTRLADRVDRRVGDLREQLLEVGEQRRRLVGEHGEREVVAHRADRLLALGRHRREQHAQVLLRVAERELAGAQRLARHARRWRSGRSSSRTTPSLVPLAVRAARRRPARLISSSSTIRPSPRSTRKSLPGCRRPLRSTFSGGSSSTPASEAEHDPAVLASPSSGRGAGRCGRASRRSRGRR